MKLQLDGPSAQLRLTAKHIVTDRTGSSDLWTSPAPSTKLRGYSRG
jgi:hypothetical protein